MWKHCAAAALAVGTIVMVSGSQVAAQGYAPWPPPPGMTAGEYVARYGHLVPPNQRGPRYDPRWERDRQYRPYPRERQRRYYDEDDD